MMKRALQTEGISHTFSSFPLALTEISFRSRPSKTRGGDEEEPDHKNKESGDEH